MVFLPPIRYTEKRLVAETLYRPGLDIELAQARKTTIESILRTGLLPASRLADTRTSYMGSADTKPHPVVYGVAIQSGKDNQYHFGVRSVAHAIDTGLQGINGVFPVIVERYGEEQVINQSLSPDDRQQQRMFSERALSSFLVLCDHPEGNPTRKPDGVPAHQFLQAVFPEPLWEEYSEHGGESFGVPIATIRERALSPIGGLPYPILVPDYAAHVRDLVLTEQRDVWIHGVRVPTSDDITRSSRNPALV